MIHRLILIFGVAVILGSIVSCGDPSVTDGTTVDIPPVEIPTNVDVNAPAPTPLTPPSGEEPKKMAEVPPADDYKDDCDEYDDDDYDDDDDDDCEDQDYGNDNSRGKYGGSSLGLIN